MRNEFSSSTMRQSMGYKRVKLKDGYVSGFRKISPKDGLPLCLVSLRALILKCGLRCEPNKTLRLLIDWFKENWIWRGRGALTIRCEQNGWSTCRWSGLAGRT